MTCAAALGGLLGTVARYWLNAAIQERAGTLFPLGIFVVNVLGCFAIGLIAALFSLRGGRADVVMAALPAGSIVRGQVQDLPFEAPVLAMEVMRADADGAGFRFLTEG